MLSNTRLITTYFCIRFFITEHGSQLILIRRLDPVIGSSTFTVHQCRASNDWEGRDEGTKVNERYEREREREWMPYTWLNWAIITL